MPNKQDTEGLYIALVNRIDGPGAFAVLVLLIALGYGALSKDILYTAIFSIIITIIYFIYRYNTDNNKITQQQLVTIKDEHYAEKIGNLSIHYMNYNSKSEICEALFNESQSVLFNIGCSDKADGLRRRREEATPPPRHEP